MKKLFISQPMGGKSNEEVIKERDKVANIVKEKIGEDVEVIDSFYENAPEESKPLWLLAKALEFLSDADCVYFTNGWQNYRGCRIEHECAIEYGIDIVGE